MEDDFAEFLGIIAKLRQCDRLTEPVKLLLFGQIEWAVVRGDLTQNEGRRLTEQMDPTFRERNAAIIELATTGELETDPGSKAVAGLAG